MSSGLLEDQVYVFRVLEVVVEPQDVGVVLGERRRYEFLHDIDFALEPLCIADFFFGNGFYGSIDRRAFDGRVENLAIGAFAQLLG